MLTAGAGLALALSLEGSTSVKLPKAHVSASFTATAPNASAGSNSTAGSSKRAAAPRKQQSALVSAVKAGYEAVSDKLHERAAAALERAGFTPAAYAALTAPLKQSASNMLDALEAMRVSYEKTLRSFFGLLLDNTSELRKSLEDGNAVIDTIRTLRGAECEPAAFDPPTVQPARITGPGGAFAITTGECTLARTAAPLREEYVLSCVEPGVSVSTSAPAYTSRFVSAAAATTEECRVERRYGVESETVITLFDPASFYASEAEAEAEVEAAGGRGQRNRTAAAAGWLRTMFPVKGKAGERVTFMPADLGDAVAKALKDASLEMSLSYKPFSLTNELQATADAVTRALAQSYDVKSKFVKMHKDMAASWADPQARASLMQDLSLSKNLRQHMGGLNMSRLFDGVFSQTAGKVLSKLPGGEHLGKGQAASVAAAAAQQIAEERPLRSLLAKAREGAGQPVNIRISSSLEDAVNALPELSQGALAGRLKSALAGDAAAKGAGGKAPAGGGGATRAAGAGAGAGAPGGLGGLAAGLGQRLMGGGAGAGKLGGAGAGLQELLAADPAIGAKLKQLADALGAASAGLKAAAGK